MNYEKISTILKSFDNVYLRPPLGVQSCMWILNQKGSGSGSGRDSLGLTKMLLELRHAFFSHERVAGEQALI